MDIIVASTEKSFVFWQLAYPGSKPTILEGMNQLYKGLFPHYDLKFSATYVHMYDLLP